MNHDSTHIKCLLALASLAVLSCSAVRDEGVETRVNDERPDTSESLAPTASKRQN